MASVVRILPRPSWYDIVEDLRRQAEHFRYILGLQDRYVACTRAAAALSAREPLLAIELYWNEREFLRGRLSSREDIWWVEPGIRRLTGFLNELGYNPDADVLKELREKRRKRWLKRRGV